jgi:nucleotide-binding universal stress UspA family protein
MYNHILVAVDGSETAQRALREAITLAKEQDAELRIVNVVDLTLAYSDEAVPYIFEYQKALTATGEKILHDCLAAARAAGIKCDGKSIAIERLGQHVYDAIEEEAKRWPAELIVIGTHGRRGVRRLILGSVAEGLARISSKPVLLIRGASG